MKRLDSIDLRILRILQVKGRVANAELADQVGLSTSACHKRLQSLLTESVVDSFVGLVNPRAVDLNVTVFVEIKLSRQVDELLVEFEKAVKLIPEVLECHLMTGEADYLLKVVARDTENFEQIHRKYLSRLPNVSNMTSSFALRKVHKTTALPI